MLRIKINHTAKNELLRDLSSRALAGLAGDAVRDGLEVLAEEVRRRAPVRTGALRGSVKVVVSRPRDGSAFGEVVVGEHYASFVEFGTSKLAARPFIRPAVQAARDRVAAALADDLKNGPRG